MDWGFGFVDAFHDFGISAQSPSFPELFLLWNGSHQPQAAFGVSRWGSQESVTEMLNNQEKLSEKGIEVRLSYLNVMDPGFWFTDDDNI